MSHCSHHQMTYGPVPVCGPGVGDPRPRGPWRRCNLIALTQTMMVWVKSFFYTQDKQIHKLHNIELSHIVYIKKLLLEVLSIHASIICT